MWNKKMPVPESAGNLNDINGSGNTVIQQINNNYGISRAEIEAIIEDILKNRPPLSEMENKRKTKLVWDYMTTSIDMDASIKEIYKTCYKICIKELSDDENYRTIKNLIDIVDRLTISDVEYILALPNNRINFLDNKFIKLKNLGLIDSTVNQEKSNILIQQELRRLRDLSTGDGSKWGYKMSSNTNNFIIVDVKFTLEGKLLYKLVENNNGEISDSLYREILDMLKF